MQRSASLSSDHFDHVLARLGPEVDLDDLARQTGAIQRPRVLNSGATLLRLALARGPGGLSLSQTAAWASALGLACMSDPAVKYRLDRADGFLNTLLSQHVSRKAQSRSICWHGRTLRMADGSAIAMPGGKGSDWWVHAVYDLGQNGFSHLELTDTHGAERINRGAPVDGEIRIGDRNYARLEAMHSLRGKAAVAPADGGFIGRHDPGIPGIFPLRTSMTPTSTPRFGA